MLDADEGEIGMQMLLGDEGSGAWFYRESVLARPLLKGAGMGLHCHCRLWCGGRGMHLLQLELLEEGCG